MTEKYDSKVVNLDEHLALKNLVNSISDEELETAKKYLEALNQIKQKPSTKPKG